MVLFYAFPLVSLVIIMVAILAPYASSLVAFATHTAMVRRSTMVAISHAAMRHVRFANRGLYMARLTTDAKRWPATPHYVGGMVHVDCRNTRNVHARPYSAALVRDAARWVGASDSVVERNLTLAQAGSRAEQYGTDGGSKVQVDASASWAWQYGQGV